MPTEPEKQKRCSECKEEKAVTEFYKRKDSKNGYRSNCKKCQNARSAKYRASNKEKIAASKAEWSRKNRDKRRVVRHRRRARKANARGTHTEEQWKARLAYHGYRCVYCGIEKQDTPQKYLTMEHLIPLSRSGSNWPSNLAPSCTRCNCSKGTRTHFEYLEYLNGKKEV